MGTTCSGSSEAHCSQLGRIREDCRGATWELEGKEGVLRGAGKGLPVGSGMSKGPEAGEALGLFGKLAGGGGVRG